MNILLRYYALQGWHYWQNLSLRFKLELLVIATIFTAFFSEKLTVLFGSWLSTISITPLGLSAFILHTLLLFYAISVPFIYYKLLPKQVGFRLLNVQPLTRASLLILLILSSAKYHLIPILLMIPVLIALSLTTNLIALTYFLAGIIIYPILYLLTIHYLNTSANGYFRPVAKYFFILICYFGIFVSVYLYLDYYLLYQTVITLLACWLFYRNRNILDTIRFWYGPQGKVQTFPLLSIRYNEFPGILRPLIAREMIVSLRNIRYLRLKIASTLLYILLLITGHEYFDDTYVNFVSAITLLFIWLHYSYQFNEKYVQPEIVIFMRTMPLRFFRLVAARIISEIVYILILLVLQNLILILYQTPFDTILYLSTGIIIFAVVVLYIIAIVRIQFYDNPRLAGYAYHFLVIFSVMMSINFYLVGPVITFALLIYLTYLSRKQIVT